jgi:anti-sigma factor RsiW
MDCRTVREVADSFLSEELLVETNHEVIRHLATCAACRAELGARDEIRRRVRRAFERAAELDVRPDFVAELTKSLKPPASGVSRRSVLRSWWTAAAGVLLAVGGGAMAVRQVRSRSRLAALAVMAAGDHQNCAIKFNLSERPIPLAEAARQYGKPYAELASLEIPPLVPVPEMLDRHSCVYSGQRFAHVVMRYRGAVTSLLVTRGDAPAEPQVESRRGSTMVASLPAGEFVAFVVADLASDDVLRIARAIAPALERQLSG